MDNVTEFDPIGREEAAYSRIFDEYLAYPEFADQFHAVLAEAASDARQEAGRSGVIAEPANDHQPEEFTCSMLSLSVQH